MDTELEGGDSQNVEVITSNNDRIDVEDESYKKLQYQKVRGRPSDDGKYDEHLKVVGGPGPAHQLPLYNVFSPYDLTSLPYINTKHTTPSNMEVTPTLPSLLPSLPTVDQLYNLPASTTPSLPVQLPVITQEQLNYIQLLQHGFNPLHQLAAGAPLGQNSVSTVVHSRVLTSSVTLTESQEYKSVPARYHTAAHGVCVQDHVPESAHHHHCAEHQSGPHCGDGVHHQNYQATIGLIQPG